MILEISLAISVLLNVVFVFYCRWLIKSYEILVEDAKQIQDVILEFNSHLGSIYELEMFYGDETLSSLMAHGRQLNEMLEGLNLLDDYDENETTT
tara:strand:- start:1396 stop:1680 length:285 start_codon:yes stop_codon:yes gene_type:complete